MDNSEGQAKTIRPPYVAYRTFRNYLDGLRPTGVPGSIDRSGLKSLSGVVQGQLITALKYLGFIDHAGTPQPSLGRLVHADGEVRKKLLRESVEAAYPFLFNGSVSIHNATLKQLQTAFEAQGVTGDTVRKCIKFFLGAAKDAGIQTSPHIKLSWGKRNGGRRRGQAPADVTASVQSAMLETSATASGAQPTTPATPNLYQMLIAILDPKMDDVEKAAVWTLIQYLKKQEG